MGAETQRWLAAGLLAVAILAAGVLATMPLRAALTAQAEVQERLARYEATLFYAGETPGGYDLGAFAAADPDDASALLALQTLVDATARQAGLAVGAIAPRESESVGDIARLAWLEATLTGDLQAIVEFLAALDAERPLVIVRAIDLQPLQGFAAGPISARLEIGRIARSDGAAS